MRINDTRLSKHREKTELRKPKSRELHYQAHVLELEEIT